MLKKLRSLIHRFKHWIDESNKEDKEIMDIHNQHLLFKSSHPKSDLM